MSTNQQLANERNLFTVEYSQILISHHSEDFYQTTLVLPSVLVTPLYVSFQLIQSIWKLLQNKGTYLYRVGQVKQEISFRKKNSQDKNLNLGIPKISRTLSPSPQAWSSSRSPKTSTGVGFEPTTFGFVLKRSD